MRSESAKKLRKASTASLCFEGQDQWPSNFLQIADACKRCQNDHEVSPNDSQIADIWLDYVLQKFPECGSVPSQKRPFTVTTYKKQGVYAISKRRQCMVDAEKASIE